MSWPPASDYQDSIQNPLTAFNDTELKTGKVAINKIGLPRVASGNFASVYEMTTASHRWAVRCFLRQGEDQQNRYALLSFYLSRLSVAGLVEFGYQSEGIRVRGKWYPVVKMEWVEGETLTTYVQKHLHQAETLRNLALQWRGLVDRLRQHHIAHADLQHGNVLVSPQGQLRLVDYDGMFVPSLRGRRSSELGHINYQHPQRSPEDYDERLDNFSALVIYTALMALSLEPGLWKRFDTGENMLFTAQDFRAPTKSVLLEYLRQHADSGLRALAETLIAACHGAIAQTPDFRTVVDSLVHGPLPEPWWQNSHVEEAHPPLPRKALPGVPPMPPARSPVVPAPLPPWVKEPHHEAATVPAAAVARIPAPPAPPHRKDVKDVMEEGRAQSRSEPARGWRSSSCLLVVAVMFGMGMLSEVAYEKVTAQRIAAHGRAQSVIVKKAAVTKHRAAPGVKKHGSTR